MRKNCPVRLSQRRRGRSRPRVLERVKGGPGAGATRKDGPENVRGLLTKGKPGTTLRPVTPRDSFHLVSLPDLRDKSGTTNWEPVRQLVKDGLACLNLETGVARGVVEVLDPFTKQEGPETRVHADLVGGTGPGPGNQSLQKVSRERFEPPPVSEPGRMGREVMKDLEPELDQHLLQVVGGPLSSCQTVT